MKRLIGIGLVLGLFLFAGIAQAEAACTGTVVADVTQNITNDPDSGSFGGYWALDNFSRHIQIWEDSGQYCAQADDNGTFTTAGAADKKSPQSGTDMPQTITGTMVGGTFGTITGGTFTNPNDLSVSIDCAVTPDICSAGLTSYWVQKFFPGGVYNYDNNWGWTYTSTMGESWVNAAAGSTGDIHAIYNSTSQVGYATLQGAIDAATAGDTIELGGDVTLPSQLNVNRSVTIDGKGHTLGAGFNSASVIEIIGDGNNVTLKNLVEDATGTSGNRGINIYKVTGVTLDNVTVQNNAKNGIVVNGSSVVVNNITTQNNAWGGINVDLGVGVTTPASLTVNGVSHHTEAGPDIKIDDITKNVSVVDSNNQYASSLTGNVKTFKLKTVASSEPVVVTNAVLPVSVIVDDGASASINLDSIVDDLTGQGTLPQITIDSSNVDVDIQASTVVNGGAGWDGVINAPTVVSAPEIVASSGQVATPALAIEVGAGNTALTFDKPVKLTFAGQAGKLAGWVRGGVFSTIDEVCNDATNPTLVGEECKIDVGADLVVWTKHFTTFVTYTESAKPVSTPSSSAARRASNLASLGGGAVASTPAASVAAGEVLGAFTGPVELSEVTAIKLQLVALIQQLIGLLQAELAAAIAAGAN